MPVFFTFLNTRIW